MSKAGPIQQKAAPAARRKAAAPAAKAKAAPQAQAQRKPGMPDAQAIQSSRAYAAANFFGDSSIVNGTKTSGSGPVQAKIPMGKPGDRFEVEADSMADKVMQMPETGQKMASASGADASGSAQGKPEANASAPASDVAQRVSRLVTRKEEEGIQASAEEGAAPAQAMGAADSTEKAQTKEDKALPTAEEGPSHNKDPVQSSSLVSRKSDEAAAPESGAVQASLVSRIAGETDKSQPEPGVQASPDPSSPHSALQTSLSAQREEAAEGAAQASFISRTESEPADNKGPPQATTDASTPHSALRTPDSAQKEEAADGAAQKSDDPAAQARVQTSCPTCGGDHAAQSTSDSAQAASLSAQRAPLSAKGGGQSSAVPGEVETQINSSKGSGQPMDQGTKGFMENRFGADFSGVRIHNDGNAAAMTGGIKAQAFAHGSDIYFAPGKYNPETSSGKHLLAHELTHTIQQGAAEPVQQKAEKETASAKEEEQVSQSADEQASAKEEEQVSQSADEQASAKEEEQVSQSAEEQASAKEEEQVSQSADEQVSAKANFPSVPNAKAAEPPKMKSAGKDAKGDKGAEKPAGEGGGEGAKGAEGKGTKGGKGGKPAKVTIDVPPPPAKQSEPKPAPEIRRKEETAEAAQSSEEPAQASSDKEAAQTVRRSVVPLRRTEAAASQIQRTAQPQIQRLEKKTNDAKPEPAEKGNSDGEAVKGKSNAKIESDPDMDEDAPKTAGEMDEDARKKAKPDPAKKRAKDSEVKSEGVTEPPVNRGAVAMEKASAEKAKTEAKLNEGGSEAPGKEPGDKGGKAELSPAEAAAAKSAAAQAEATALQPPGPPKPFDHPVIETPVDSAGQKISPDSKTDSHVRGMGEINATLRDTGYQMQLFAFEEKRIALGNDSAIWKQKEDLENSKTGTKQFEEHNTERKGIAEKAKTAHKETEERAAFVSEHAEKLGAESDKSKEESSQVASEANSTAAQNEAEPAGDADAEADKAKSQGDMNETKDGTSKMDGAVGGVGDRAKQYGGEAAAAAGTNQQSGAKISANDAAIAKLDARVAQLHAENAKSQGQLSKAEKGPGEVKKEAQKTAKSGEELIAATEVAEADLKAIQAKYLADFKKLESKEAAEKRIEEEKKKAQTEAGPTADELQLVKMSSMGDAELEKHMEGMSDAQVESLNGTLDGMQTAASETEADKNKSKFLETDKASGQVKLKGLNEAIFGKEKGDPREEQIEAIHQERRDRLKIVQQDTDKNFGFLTAEQKQMLALKLLGKRLTDDVKNISVIQMGAEMIKGMINPVTAIKGAIGGFEKLGSGVLNLFNLDAWAKDPLGNLLKSATDIAMGLATILNSIVGLAVIITALMVAITIVTWGFALPVTGPVMGWMGTVISTVGGWAFWVSAVALVLNYLSFIKNLHDAGAAQSSEELLGETDAMYENTTGALESAMNLAGGKGGQKMGPKLGGPKWLPMKGANGKWIKGKEFMKQLGTNVKTGAKNFGTGLSAAAKGLMAKGKGGLKSLSDRIKRFFTKRKEKKAGGKTDATPGGSKTTPHDSPAPTHKDGPDPHKTGDGPDPKKQDGPDPKKKDDGPEPTKKDDGSDPKKKDDGSEPTKKDDGAESKKKDDGSDPKKKDDGSDPKKKDTDTPHSGDKVDGKKVLSEEKLPDGHTMKVLEDGSCVICSICEKMSAKYHNELRQNPELAKGLDALQSKLANLPPHKHKTIKRKIAAIEQKLKNAQLKTKGTPAVRQKYHTELGDPKNAKIKSRLEALEGKNPYTKKYQNELKKIQKELEFARSARKLDRGGGHGFGDHGAHVTPAQHRHRLQTGNTPSGRTASIPSKSSSFVSNSAQVEAATRAKAALASEVSANGFTQNIKIEISAKGAGKSYSLNSAGALNLPPTPTSTVTAWFHRRGTPGNYYYVMGTIFPE